MGWLRGIAAEVGLWLIIAGGVGASLAPREIAHWAPPLVLGLIVFLGVLGVMRRG